MTTLILPYRSRNFAWLKAIALTMMLFDHVAVCCLRQANLDVHASWWRLPGRFCIPVFAFLVAYNYIFVSRHRGRYVRRVLALAMVSEPLYWLCFHEFGNAFMPLALALLALHTSEIRDIVPRHSARAAVWIIALGLAVVTRAPDVFLEFAMGLCFASALRGSNAWLTAAFILAFLCNWPSAATGAALFATFTCIVIALHFELALPALRIPKALAYAFYPAHLLLLSLLFPWK